MVDALDEKIISILGRDPAQPQKEIAKKLGVSLSTVRRRIGKLVQQKMIRMAVLVDPFQVGFPLVATIGFDVFQDKVQEAMLSLARLPEVKWISYTTGRYDVLALAWFRSTEELTQFMQRETAKIDGIKDTETFICLSIGKGKYMPFPL